MCTFGLSLAAASGLLNPSSTSVERAFSAIPDRVVAFSTCTVTRFGAGRVTAGVLVLSVGQAVLALPVSRLSTRHHTIAASRSSAASAMTAGNGRRIVGLTTAVYL